MTKASVRPFLGKPCLVCWRDPESDSGWTEKGLGDETRPVETLGWPLGFNARGEFVVASSRGCRNGEVGDRNVIPLPLIERIVEVAPHPHQDEPGRERLGDR